jgi:hypothetical protein
MDDLRSEIRAAFEREQRAHPPTSGLRDDIVDAVSMNPRRAPNFQWLAVAAAVILAALVVIGLMSTRFHPRSSVPAATPNASPVADYGPPPAGVPLLYVNDPNHPSWLIGFDWSGNPRGTVKVDTVVGSVGMAPDGQSFAVGFGAKGGTGEMLDRLGQPIPGGAIPGSTLPIWADDYKHTCGISFDPQTLTSTLVTVAQGQPVKSVAVLGRDQNLPGSYRIASCSFRNDQAIVVRISNVWPSQFLVVRLSDGQVILSNTYDKPELLSNLVASADSKLIAENASKSVGQLQGQTAPATRIRRVADVTVVATLPPTVQVLAFNGDDSLVLVATNGWVGGQPTALAVIDLQSGQSIWSYNGPGMFGNALAQPGGRDFAIYVRKPAVQDPLTDLMIVHADGTATDFPRRFNPPGEVDLTPDAGRHDWPSVWGGGFDGGRDARRRAAYRPARVPDHRRGRAPAPAS